MPDNERKTTELMEKAPTDLPGRTADAVAAIENAVDHERRAAPEQAGDSEARLEKIEEQVHALSDAVIAIAEFSGTVDATVKTLKDKM